MINYYYPQEVLIPIILSLASLWGFISIDLFSLNPEIPVAINSMAQESKGYKEHLSTEKAKIIIHINMDYNKEAKTSY